MIETYICRESWLNAARELLDAEFFEGRGYNLPKSMRVSCGFHQSASSNAIGQCWDKEVSADKIFEIFICPTQAAPRRVLDILLHEMIHASVGVEIGHRGIFRKLAKEFGLAGKMTATIVEAGSDLDKILETMAGLLGTYPHAPMAKRRKRGKPNQTHGCAMSP